MPAAAQGNGDAFADTVNVAAILFVDVRDATSCDILVRTDFCAKRIDSKSDKIRCEWLR